MASTTDSNNNNTTGGAEPLNGQTGPGTAEKPFDQGNTTGEPSAASNADTNPLPNPSSGVNPQQKHQGADRPREEPQSGEQVDAVRATKEKAERAMDPTADDDDQQPVIQHDPNDHSGEPMRDHSGDAKAAAGDGDKSEDQKKEELGTGEKWVKSTGVEADGGDFDAAKPGAAREADRILEEKGIHHSSAADDDAAGNKDPLDPTNKPTLTTKVKDILHLTDKP